MCVRERTCEWVWWLVIFRQPMNDFHVRHVCACGMYSMALCLHECLWAGRCKQINQNQSNQWRSVGTIAATAIIFPKSNAQQQQTTRHRKLGYSRHFPNKPYEKENRKKNISHKHNTISLLCIDAACPLFFATPTTITIVVALSKIRMNNIRKSLWMHHSEFYIFAMCKTFTWCLLRYWST